MDRLENSVSRTTLAISLVNKQSPSAALSCGVLTYLPVSLGNYGLIIAVLAVYAL